MISSNPHSRRFIEDDSLVSLRDSFRCVIHFSSARDSSRRDSFVAIRLVTIRFVAIRLVTIRFVAIRFVAIRSSRFVSLTYITTSISKQLIN